MNTESIIIPTSNNQKLNAILLKPEEKKESYPAVIFIHGWMSDLRGYIPRAEVLVKLGYICLVFDMRGHGESDGKLGEVTAEGSLEDAMAAYDYVASLPEVDKNNINVVGSSYGGYIAALVTDKRPVASLVLRVPAIYRNETFNTPKVKEIRNELKAYRQASISSKDNFALQALAKFTNPILIIESENDTIIPHQALENYRKALNPKTKLTNILMKEADHSLTKTKWKQEFIEILIEWFKR